MSRHLSLLERSPMSSRLRFTPFWLVPTIKAGTSVPLQGLANQNRGHMCLVPGIIGNEEADVLAGVGSILGWVFLVWGNFKLIFLTFLSLKKLIPKI
jgi:hypothetical protein